MTVRRLVVLSLSLIVSIVALACSSSGEIPEATDVESVGQALKAAGMRVEGPNDNGLLAGNYFSVPGVQYEASGETIFVYEFESDEETTAQKDLVSPDGWGIGLKYINWTVAPSYYQNGRLIVIYDGDKDLVKSTLVTAMGERFAGSEPA